MALQIYRHPTDEDAEACSKLVDRLFACVIHIIEKIPPAEQAQWEALLLQAGRLPEQAAECIETEEEEFRRWHYNQAIRALQPLKRLLERSLERRFISTADHRRYLDLADRLLATLGRFTPGS